MWPQITNFLTWISAPALLWLSPNLLQTTNSLLFYNFVFHCNAALAYFWPPWCCAPASPFALSHTSPVEAFGARAVFLLQSRAWLQPHPCSTLIFRVIKMTTTLSCIKMSKCQIVFCLRLEGKITISVYRFLPAIRVTSCHGCTYFHSQQKQELSRVWAASYLLAVLKPVILARRRNTSCFESLTLLQCNKSPVKARKISSWAF